MHLNGFEELEQLASSPGIVSFMELINGIIRVPNSEPDCANDLSRWERSDHGLGR
jgi:hypothetical protein